MDAFLEHAYLKRAGDHAPERGGKPKLVVIAAAGIEANDQRGAAETGGQVLDIMRQIVTARFLAGLDEDHAVRVRKALLGEGEDRGERSEERITIIGAAAAIELVVLDDRDPGAGALFPSRHFRL